MNEIFKDAAWRNNPAWSRLLGLCPLLAVTTTLENALGLAAASAFVVIGSAGDGVPDSRFRPGRCPVTGFSCWSSQRSLRR